MSKRIWFLQLIPRVWSRRRENTQLRSSNIDYPGVEDELVQESDGMNSLDDFLVPDVFVAIAADKKSIETFFIIKITIGE